MGIWGKLITAIKGGANEVAEAVVDSQAMRILDQEIREAKTELQNSDVALTKIMAKRKLAEQKVSELQNTMKEFEQHARSASAKGDQSLALECAQRVVDLQAQCDVEQQALDQYKGSEQTLRSKITQAKQHLRRMEQQVDMVKATESVQKAQVAVSSRYTDANSSMKTAAESLARIQEKQRETQAELDSASELSAEETGDDLQARLKAAGITDSAGSAESELARILGR